MIGGRRILVYATLASLLAASLVSGVPATTIPSAPDLRMAAATPPSEPAHDVAGFLATLQGFEEALRPLGIEGLPIGETLDPYADDIPWDLIDSNRAHNTRIIPAGVTENHTGSVAITEDWLIYGNVTFHDAQLTIANGKMLSSEAGGRLVLDGATTVQATSPVPARSATIRSNGGDVIVRGAAGQPVVATNTLFAAVRPTTGGPGLLDIDHAQLRDVVTAASFATSTGRMNATSVVGTTVGVLITNGIATAPADPLLTNNTFVDNAVAVRVDKGLFNWGTLRRSQFTANALGVYCPASGNLTLDRFPVIAESNFEAHLQEAYQGVDGKSVLVPLIGPVSIAASHCILDRNWFEPGQSLYKGQDDEQTDASSRWTLQAPPSPVPVYKVTGAETWPGARGIQSPFQLDGPVVATNGGVLTLNGMVLDSQTHLVGSTKGGRLVVRDAVVRDAAIMLSNQSATGGDDVDGLEISGRQRLAYSLWTYHSNAVVTGLRAHDISGTVWSPTGRIGELTDTSGTSGLDLCVIDRIGTLAPAVQQATSIHNCVMHDVGSTISPFLGGTVDFLGNNITRYGQSVLALLGGAATSTDNTWQAGRVAMGPVLAGTLTSTHDAVFTTRVGVLVAFAASFDGKTNHFAFNQIAVEAGGSGASAVIASSDFIDNYQAALFNAYLFDLVSNNGYLDGTITCNAGCHTSPDEIVDGDHITFVRQPASNGPALTPMPFTPLYADAPGESVVPPAQLTGPVLAKNGGRIVVRNATIDGGGMYPLGVKGNRANVDGISGAPGPEGGMVIDNSTIRAAVAVAASEDSVLRYSTLRRTELRSIDDGPTVQCVSVPDADVFITHSGRGDQPALLRRVLLNRSQLAMAGDSAGHAPWIEMRDSLGIGSSDVANRNSNARIELHGNNFNPTGSRGLYDSYAPASAAVVHAEDNYWGHPSGPEHWELRIEKNPTLYGFVPYQQTNTDGARLYHILNGSVPVATGVLTNPNPVAPCAVFDAPLLAVDDGAPAAFLDRSFPLTPDGATSTWNWGDESAPEVVAGPAVAHQFLDAGNFTVTLTVEAPLAQWTQVSGAWQKTLSGSVSESMQRTVRVTNALPRANFTWTPVPIDDATSVTFQDTSFDPSTQGSITSRTWTFGDGTNASGSTVTHTFPDDQNYTVCLRVLDNDGANDTRCRIIVVANAPPTASFTSTPADADDSNPVQFASTSSDPGAGGGIAALAWSFGDGTNATGAAPLHQFRDDGTYTVCLTATDSDGASDMHCQEQAVANAGPHAGFYVAFAAPTDGIAVPFQSVSTDDSVAGRIVGHAWDFGDGTTSTINSTSHVFQEPGTYSVCLEVTDDDGATDEICHAVEVGNSPPTLSIAAAPGAPDPGEVVTFTASASDPSPLGFVASIAWDFGDGTTGSGTQTQHTYAEAGQFTVTATATDDDGASTVRTQTVNVGNNPPAFDPIGNQTGTEGRLLTFTLHAQDPEGQTVSYGAPELPTWATLDASTGNFSWRPSASQAGTYALTFTASDGQATAETTVQVSIADNQAPIITANIPATVDARQVASYSATATDPEGRGVSGWSWDFATGTDVVLLKPGASVTHSFGTMGSYEVGVSAQDGDGIRARVGRTVTVDDALLGALTVLGPSFGEAGPRTPITIRYAVTDDADRPVAGAVVTVIVEGQGTVKSTSTYSGSTDALGVFQVAHQPQAGGVAHLPGPHRVTAMATNASRPGAPVADLETATRTSMFEVVYADANDACPIGDLEDCTGLVTDVLLDLVEQACDGSPSVNRCLQNAPNPCADDGQGATEIDACVGLVYDVCEDRAPGSGVGACTAFILAQVGLVEEFCEARGQGSGVLACVNWVGGLAPSPSEVCESLPMSTGYNSPDISACTEAVGDVAARVVECVMDLASTDAGRQSTRATCDLT